MVTILITTGKHKKGHPYDISLDRICFACASESPISNYWKQVRFVSLIRLASWLLLLLNLPLSISQALLPLIALSSTSLHCTRQPVLEPEMKISEVHSTSNGQRRQPRSKWKVDYACKRKTYNINFACGGMSPGKPLQRSKVSLCKCSGPGMDHHASRCFR